MPRRAEPLKPPAMAPRQRAAAEPAPQPAPAPAARRVAAFRLGLSAESRAAMLLIAKGHRIAARRWKTPVGEIDIVARRRRDLVFVEVKARDTLDAAAESVTARNQQRIVAAAEFWLSSHPDDVERFIRFDVILVAPGKMPRHIVNAFDATR
jgi:putative endonuclease